MAIKKGATAVKQEEMEYLSEDSDFYESGDEAAQQELEARAGSFDPAEWWKHKVPSLTETADASLASGTIEKAATMYNPYEGSDCGRQLGESVDEFLQRLPPSTTTQDSDRTPWIFIANPYRKAPKPGNENALAEGPPDDDSEWAKFVTIGNNLLQELVILRNQIEKEKPNSAKATVTRAVNVQRDVIVKQLLDYAIDLHCTSGKWMIFCPPEEVNAVWGVVARATANNELGIAAKFAPDSGDDRKPRLMCIYTKDFSDEDDVTRVINKLRGLGLVETRGKPIYYKCDAYTYLGLNSDNQYNIQASLYKSSDFLKPKGKEATRGKISGFFYKKKEDDGRWKALEQE
ncbi:UPF0696 protein-like protein [Lachnellula suecica]|uniref:UPF0696 protein-like protein n=1 Tax=Lachnellula suecica TaxID=602035 RepID=A0A8T9CBU7_9HELO|nr:UPF0696 protein-like protein [Lachnellula suecica]